MFITPSFKKSLIVEQFQGNYLNLQNLKKDGSGRSLGEGGGVETTYQNVRDVRHLPRVQNQGF